VKNGQAEKGRTWTNTGEIKTINDIGMYGALLAF